MNSKKSITLSHKFNLQLAGKPTLDILDCPAPTEIGVHPYVLPNIKPRAAVKIGDKVEIGSPLFYSKKDTRIQFLSPGSGIVSDIVYGERRRLECIKVKLDKSESSVSFPKFSQTELLKLEKKEIVNSLLERGFWGFLRSLPFRNIPSPEETPPSIIISLDNDEPFQPDSDVFLRDNIDAFKLGLSVLEQICPNIVTAASNRKSVAQNELSQFISLTVTGPYPSNEPGTILYHSKKSESENKSWYISPQDVIVIGQGFSSGQFPIHRIAVIGGSLSTSPQHLTLRLGTPISKIPGSQINDKNTRYIAGGIFTGRKADSTDYLSYGENALQCIPEGQETEFMSFMRLGLNKPSYSKTFLSSLFPNKAWKVTSSLNGSTRDCISCSHCPEVCPVGLLPQWLLKNIKGNDIDNALNLGLLDCTECGLCTTVCPSKIELDSIFKSTKTQLQKEIEQE